MTKGKLLTVGIVGLTMFFSAYAVEFTVENDGKTYDFDIGGYGGFLGGQVIRGFAQRLSDIDHPWVENAWIGLLFDATINEKMRVILNPEFAQVFSYNVPETELGVEHHRDLYWVANWLYVREAHGYYTLGDPEALAVQIHAGKWHYKYNPEVRNLGEYLMRGNCYPTFYATVFDDPTYPLLGFMLRTSYHHQVVSPNLDVILTSETARHPMQDWSLAGVASFDLLDMWEYGSLINLGAGICFDKLIPKNKFYTTPDDGKPGLENIYDIDITYDTTGFDPVTLEPIVEEDTTSIKRYTFAGTKASARFCLDPKVFFDWENIFTEDDLKIYGELAILGFQNYPDIDAPGDTINYLSSYYAFREDRMPFMVGINIPFVPFFHIFDVVSVELEWFDTPYVKGFTEAYDRGWPLPSEYDLKLTKFYWSVYAKKQLGAFKFVTQFARDHVRPVILNFDYTDRNDVLVSGDHWWWCAKVEFGI